MKTLLTFLTIVLFSFGASALNKNFTPKECSVLKEKSKINFNFFYLMEKRYLKEDAREKDKKVLKRVKDDLLMLSSIYNAFCKD